VTERRKFLRFNTALNGICEAVNEKFKAPSKIKNISKEGALLVIDKPVTEGSELNLSMNVPGDNVPVFASCTVAWQRGINRSEGPSSYVTGVKFTKINNLDKGRLLEYIYSQWLKLLDNE